MHTEVLAVDAHAPQPDRIARAAAVLRGGGLVAFPTETVYGLGALALDAAAVGRIFAAKGRPANNPVIVHIADAERGVASRRGMAGRRRTRWRAASGPARSRWSCRATPTCRTRRRPAVRPWRCACRPIPWRWPCCGPSAAPVAAPSANRSAELSPTLAEHVLRGLAGRIDLVLDGGPTAGGIESTVLDMTTSPPRLLRPGLIGPAELEAVIGPISRTGAPPTGGGAAVAGDAAATLRPADAAGMQP